MLPIYQLCDTNQLQNALSMATNNRVTKQSIIHQAAANFSGFPDFQSALALTDRSHLIRESVWAEQHIWSEQKLWHIHAGYYTFCIDTVSGALKTFYIDGEMLHDIDLPNNLRSYQIDKDEIDYDHSMKKIVIRTKIGIDIVFHRHNKNKIGVLINHEDYTITKNFDIDDTELDAFSTFFDSATQLPRLLDEISAVREGSIDIFEQRSGMTGQDIEDTINTASWLFESDKGNLHFANEIKPNRTLAKPIGYVADLLLNSVSNDTPWVTEMCESMSINHHLLNWLRGMARESAARFKFSHFVR